MRCKRRPLRMALLAAAALVSLVTRESYAQVASKAQSKPNIVVILADDLGYGDTSAYGSKLIRTPHIDALAASGVRFTAGYVTNPVCAPSRAGLMTGRYQQRFGYEFNPNGRDRSLGVSLHEITLAQILKSAGYRTAAIGKWHLGEPPGYYPTDRGFDHFFGMAGGGSVYIVDPKPGDELIGRDGTDIRIGPSGSALTASGGHIRDLLERIRTRNPISEDGKVVRVEDYLTDALTRQAVSFIDRNRQHPFFLYLAQHAPHVPLQAPKKYLDRYASISDPGKRIYAAMVSSLDDSVGAVVAALKRDGLYHDTLVIFLSDNGCAGYNRGACSNAPLSGFKRWLLEGGVRVPFILAWPGHVPAGVVDNRQVSSLDILPTAAAVAHAQVPADRAYDGVDLMPYLTGTNTSTPNPKLYWRDGMDFAMRDGDLKMWIANVAPHAQSSSGDVDDEDFDGGRRQKVTPHIGPQGQHVMLFDLGRDIGERRNLAAVDAPDVARLQGEIQSWNRQLIPPQWSTAKQSIVDYDGQTLELFY